MFKISVPRSCKLKFDGFQNFRPKTKPKQLIFAAAGGSVPPPDKIPTNYNKILPDNIIRKYKSMNNNIDTFIHR